MPPITDTRQRLIDAAAELFWERGYAATGLSEIQEAAEARAGSMYHFFPTKDELLLAVIDRQAQVIESTIENALASREDPRAKVLAVVDFYRRFMERTGCALGCPLMNLAGEIGDSHPQAAAKIAEFVERLVRRIAEPIGEGRGEHAGGPDAACIALARAILGMIHGAVAQARTSKGVRPLDACAEGVVALLDAPWRPTIVTRHVELARA